MSYRKIDPRPTKAQRRKAAIAASQSLLGLEPAEGSLAWRVWKAIRGNRVLDAITADAARIAVPPVGGVRPSTWGPQPPGVMGYGR